MSTRSWLWPFPQFMMTPTFGQQGNSSNSKHGYALVILNRPLSQNIYFLKNFWNNATIRITVDGGTYRWDMFVSKLDEEEQKLLKLPDLVTGDFDSITDEVLEKYTKKGCKVIPTPDQDQTDFTKAIIELNMYCQQKKVEIRHVIAICQCSGRIDHVLGNIQTLFLVTDKQLLSKNIRLYLISDDAISWLLSPGSNIIVIPEEIRKHKKAWCSLVPVGETCISCTTTGLKWNLSNQTLKFGKIVSTSNTFDGSENVTVSCSNPLLWSMRVPSISGNVHLVMNSSGPVMSPAIVQQWFGLCKCIQPDPAISYFKMLLRIN